MKIIWTFTLLMIPGVLSSISVTGYSGGVIIITCRYDREYKDNAKYFCRGQKPVTPQIRWCYDLIKTEEKDKWVDSGRFSLYDDTRAAVFNVTIKDLSEQDSGTYQCAVDIHLIGDSYTEVNLNVLTDTDVPKTTSSLPPSSSTSSSSSVFKTSTSNFTSESPNMLKGLPLIISLVLVLLVLIIVSVLLLFLYKKHQSRGKTPLWLISTERYRSVQYGAVRFRSEHPDPACISTANSTLDRCGVCWNVVIDNKA